MDSRKRKWQNNNPKSPYIQQCNTTLQIKMIFSNNNLNNARVLNIHTWFHKTRV